MVKHQDGVLGNTSNCGVKNVVEVSTNTNDIDELTDTLFKQVGLIYQYPSKMNIMIVHMDDLSHLNQLVESVQNKMEVYLPYFITIGQSQPTLIES
jgi:hypothetical protein